MEMGEEYVGFLNNKDLCPILGEDQDLGRIG